MGFQNADGAVDLAFDYDEAGLTLRSINPGRGVYNQESWSVRSRLRGRHGPKKGRCRTARRSWRGRNVKGVIECQDRAVVEGHDSVSNARAAVSRLLFLNKVVIAGNQRDIFTRFADTSRRHDISKVRVSSI